jgi:hypothetical protein
MKTKNSLFYFLVFCAAAVAFSGLSSVSALEEFEEIKRMKVELTSG